MYLPGIWVPRHLERDLDINPKRVGRPRLDPHQRLLSRFYEQLFLLNALGQTRGNHTIPPFELDTGRAQVRRFLQNLCYICDFKKGGSACTAIGLEELETRYNFCVASNKETGKIVAFLETSLSALWDIAHHASTNYNYKALRFFRASFEFAAERIEGEKKCLRRSIKDCLSTLDRQTVESGAFGLFVIYRQPHNLLSYRSQARWVAERGHELR